MSAPVYVVANMACRLIEVKVEVGQRVAKGQELAIVESMKMEIGLEAPSDGVVVACPVAAGDELGKDEVVVTLEVQ